jgi:Immunity protein 50
MPSIETLVENASVLVSHFGEWPSFHDAEILDFHCWRGRVKSGDWDDSNVFPVVTIKILILRATQKSYASGKPNIVATLRFHDANNVRMDGFNHINSIFDLTITTEDRGTFATGEKLRPFLAVSITGAPGMAASFRCFRAEVLDAAPSLPLDER